MNDKDPPAEAKSLGNGWYRAKVKKTGEVVDVHDAGPVFVPRYWDANQGYLFNEIEFVCSGSGKPAKARQIVDPDTLMQLMGRTRGDV